MFEEIPFPGVILKHVLLEIYTNSRIPIYAPAMFWGQRAWRSERRRFRGMAFLDAGVPYLLKVSELKNLFAEKCAEPLYGQWAKTFKTYNAFQKYLKHPIICIAFFIFHPFSEKITTCATSPQDNVDSLGKYHKRNQKNVLPNPLPRFIVNQHCSVGRGDD